MSDLIDVYTRRLTARGCSKRTISVRSSVLRHAHRWLIANGCPKGLDEAGDEDIAAYLARPLKAWSQASVYSHLRGYYKAMVKARRLTLDPTDAVDRPKSGDNTPNPVETWQLDAAIDRSPDQPWRTATILAGYEGLRCCEITVLDRDDVTEEHTHVKDGKGGKGRYVPTHPIVWDLVRHRAPGLLVVSKRGLPISAQRLSSMQYRHWGSVDLPGVHMHRFRHWFGTTLADGDVPIEVICEMMGHSSIEQTRHYIRVSVARKKFAMAALPMLGDRNERSPLDAPRNREHQPVGSRLVPTEVTTSPQAAA
jgi:site-specific recombinase XerD